jgi:predicted amidohydrolase YtcJ
MDAPDLLVTGTIYTFDPDRPEVEALLARDGRIACLGRDIDCRRAARSGVRHLHVGDGSVVPGLVDAHGHVLLHGRALEEVRCNGARDAAECAQRAAAQAQARMLPKGAWVLGRGWDENRWQGGALPHERVLTAAVPNHPVLLERVDGHAAWVNARALAEAGIGPDTPDPPAGRIVRDASGRPTGVLVDRAQDLVHACIPHPSQLEIERLLQNGLADLARLGLTAVHDAGCTSSVMRAYGRLAGGDRLPIRVYAMLDGTQPDGALAAEMARWSAMPALGMLEVRAVKLFADGALGSRGAALFDDYADEPGHRGFLLADPAALRARIRRVARSGLQPAVHAIGDRACHEVLAAFVEVGRELDLASLRPRVEHLQILRPEDLPLLRESVAVASMQPAHATSDAPWVEARLGVERARGAYAWRQVLAAGAALAFGSDFPVESPDPRLGLAAAELRCATGAAQAWHPEERLGRREALRAFTSGAAFAAFAEDRRGVLREGADADLTVLGDDALGVPAERWHEVPVLATVVAGRVAYERS